MLDANDPRMVRPGIDISLWPHMKWRRGQGHVNDLVSRVAVQAVSSGAGIDVLIAEDALSATFVARLPVQPPMAEWALIVGDAIHNYRTALDALAWDLTHLDGASPADEERIFFPICLTRRRWERLLSTSLATIPPELIARLEAVQPFTVEPPEHGIFVWLHNLDITDKHRAAVTAVARAVPRDSFRAQVVLQDGMALADGEWHLTWVGKGDPVKDGQELYKLEALHPIRKIDCDTPLQLEIQVEHAGRREDVFQMFRLLEKQMYATFRIVLDGDFDPAEIGLLETDWPVATGRS